MRGKIALLISFLVILSFFSACTTSELLVNDSEVYVCTQKPVIIDPVAQNTINMLYENYLADCKANCPTCNCEVDAKIALLITDLNSSWSPGDLGRKVILPYGFGIDRCSSSPQNPFNADLGFDLKKCPEFQEFFFNPFTYPFVMFLESYYLEYINVLGVPLEGCTPTSYNQYYLPANSKCQLKESYVLVITTTNPNPIYVNEHMLVPFDVGSGRYMSVVYFLSSNWDKTLIDEAVLMLPHIIVSIDELYIYNEIPPSISITRNAGEEVTVFLYRECCWHCNPKNKQLPVAILNPKIDIESFTLSNGTTIIQDGKILYSFNAPRGVQNTTIGIENRGFFSQNNVFIKFIGLPDGITVNTTPEFQKIKAHQIGEYEATFTVGPNVPSGTYKVTMIAYSTNGTFDTITIDLVVP